MPPITPARAGRLTIGRLAERTGVHLETIRYYERIGLLPAPPRTEGGHRVYDGGHLQRLGFVRRARELGFGLGEVRALLALAEGGGRCDEVRVVAAAHLDAVRRRIEDLRALEATLARHLAQCAGEAAPACPLVETLAGDRAAASM